MTTYQLVDPRKAGEVVKAAVIVVNNAHGTKARHTGAPYGHRDDCIPCGIDRLRAALVDLGVEGVIR